MSRYTVTVTEKSMKLALQIANHFMIDDTAAKRTKESKCADLI